MCALARPGEIGTARYAVVADTPWVDRFDPARLRALRKNRGLTQHQLGEMVGQAGKTIATYENGRRSPRPAALTKLADALGAEFTDLLKPGTLTLSVLRASRGLAQSDVAEALGVTQPWYHLIEAGTARVKPDQFARLARLFRRAGPVSRRRGGASVETYPPRWSAYAFDSVRRARGWR